ncbi:hypothetical protein, partial [Burkholderia gladioli]|uniref:hypothetical protein n=1 Tax=Burkholderia gladioli TaxID=28095 RepID=UPI003F7AE44D
MMTVRNREPFSATCQSTHDEPDRNVNPCQIQLHRIFFYILYFTKKINPYLNKKVSQRKTIFCKLSATILTVRLTGCMYHFVIAIRIGGKN